MNSSSSQEFQSNYDQFIAEHGDMFERTEVPLDESDRGKVREFYNVCYGFFFVVGAGFIALMYFNFPKTSLDTFYASAMAALTIAGPVWSYRSRKRELTKGVKTVVKGIITFKKVNRRGKTNKNTITISRREDIDILDKDYNTCRLGDIVQIEQLGSTWLRITNAKVIFLGKMPGEQEIQNPVNDPNSIWSSAGRYFGKLLK